MLRFNLRTIALTAILLLLTAGVAYGQAQSGNLYGQVLANDGSTLPGVTIAVTGAATQVQVTNSQGEFRFLGLAPGSYTLRAELESFSTLEYENIQINVGRNTTLQLDMTQAVEETITVTSESPLLDSRKITTGSTVNALELEKIPTSRDPWAILQTVPGVQVDRINVGGNESGQQSSYVGPGSSGDDAVWAVDGVVITDMGAIGASPSYYNFDAFQEMNAATGGSDATLATGGVTLNMVTKRGGNEWKGSGRFVRADDAWQSDLDFDANELGQDFDGDGDTEAQDAFAQGNRIVSVDDYGLEVGGPIVEDKLWIWANYGVQDVKLLTVADVSDDTELETYGAKINAQPSQSNSLVGFYNFGDKVKNGRNAGPTRPQPTTWNQTGPTDIYKLEDTHVFSSSFFLSGLASYVGGGFQLTPQGGLDGPESVLDPDFVWQTNFLHHETDRPQEQLKLDASYFFDTGSVGHELKFGVGYRAVELTSFSVWPGNGIRFDYNIANYDTPYEIVQITRPRAEDLETDYTSIYVQDTITTGNLTANIGIRYDKQDGQLNSADIPALPGFETFPDGRPLFPAAPTVAGDQGFEWEDITPRLGLTYAVGPERKTLLRASLSQFAQQLGQGFTTQLSTATYSYAYFYYEDTNGDGITQPNEIIDFNDGFLFSNRFDPFNSRIFNQVDPDFEAQLTDELILGVEHAIRPELVVGLTATMRNIDKISQQDRLVCDVALGTVDDEDNCDGLALRDDVRSDYVATTRTVTRPDGSTYELPIWDTRDGVRDDGGFLLKNGDREQDYLGFTVSVNKRLANRWMLRGNFTIADWEWDVPAGALDDPNNYLGAGTRDGDVVLQGSGTGSGSKGGVYINSNWSYSLTTMYQVAPDRSWGFNVAGSLNGREGYAVPYFSREFGVFNDASSVRLEAVNSADEFRLDDIHVLDLRVEKEFSVNDFAFTVGAELFNVFNESTVLQRQHRLRQTNSDHVQEILSPRVARLSVRFTF
ncbi:MAG: carboxypeptidase regulatory-like domain-containing protein [Thermoanaerobaculia bacterium]|nr:carboxypeptidase regulatory-like domain-containing protein [Thermoanaerobaculia bacterium]